MKILLSNALLSHGAFHHWMTSDMKALGHDVGTLDPDELCEQFGIDLYRRALLARIEAERPEMFLVYPPYDLLRPEDTKRIHELGTAVVGYAYDDPIYLPTWTKKPGQFETILDQYRKIYDVYLTTSRQMVREAQQRGYNWVKSILWAINTPTDPVDGPRDIPLVVIGAPYLRRVEMVKRLKAAGVPPAIFGAEGWKQFSEVADLYQGMLTRPGMFQIYRRTRIALAPSDWEATFSPMIKLRTLEVAGCGAFQLVENVEDLPDYYVEGKEVVSYKTWDELIEKIRYYLTHEDERAAIAKGGFDRTCRDHVWKVRWAEVEALVRPVVDQLRSGRWHEPGDPYDPHLVQELGASAAAHHYEGGNDYMTSNVAYEEWMVLNPNGFQPLLGKARTMFFMGNYPESEKYFRMAWEVGKNLCPMAVDITVTQRKLGPRLGLGRLFSGIFPRWLECCAYLFAQYAIQDREQDAEALVSALAPNQDHLFVAIVAIMSNNDMRRLIGPKYTARYAELLVTTYPFVWLGAQQRHNAHFWTLRADGLASMGKLIDARQCLKYALTQNPPPEINQQILDLLGKLGGL